MLEWNPRLAALVIAVVAVAASLGWSFWPTNFGWGAW
jgi:hypothetical protein